MITCSVLNSVKIADWNPKFQLTNMCHSNPLNDALTKNLNTLLLMLQGIYNFFTHLILQRLYAFSTPITIDNIHT